MKKTSPIAVNARFLLPGKMEGIGWYSHEMLSRLVKLLPERQFIFFFDRAYSNEFVYGPNVQPVVLSPPARHPFLWYIWFEWSVANALKKHNASVFFSPDGYGSLRSDVPQVLTIHDLAFEHFPGQVPYWVGKYYRHYVPRHIAHADRIISVSNATKQDIISLYNTSPAKIEVLHNGSSDIYQPLDAPSQDAVRQQLTNGAPYFIFVSALHPRKNVTGTLRAFDIFKKQHGSTHKLVVTGRKAWGNAEMEEAFSAMQHSGDVVFTGHLDRQTLQRYLASATALVYPSFFEGFGLPILEAMNCEVPVITSDISSMPEVAGDAAVLVSPEDTAQLAEAMSKL